jgi:predicted ArsR family transcriptional regulator
MNIDERRQRIIAHLMEENIVSVNALIAMLNESPATIRRDLTFLEENGYISRSMATPSTFPPPLCRIKRFPKVKSALQSLRRSDSGRTNGCFCIRAFLRARWQCS